MYCTIDDLINNLSEQELIDLTDDEQTGLYNAARIDEAITAATDKINGYCMVRYSELVPFRDIPGLIKSTCVDIAIYNLHKRRKAVSDGIQKVYEDAIATLEKIAKGTIKLMANSAKVSEDQVKFSNKTPDDRVFKDPLGYK